MQEHGSAPNTNKGINRRPLPMNSKAAKKGAVRAAENQRRASAQRRAVINTISGDGVVGAKQAKSPKGYAARSTAKPKVRERYAKFDYPFFIITMILLVFGMVMMFSASYAVAYNEFGDSFYYLRKQMLYAGVGLVALIVLSFWDYHFWGAKKIMIIMVVVAIGLMLGVKVIGQSAGGAERWIQIAGVRFQPSEVLKFVIIALFAFLGEKNSERIKDLKLGFVPFAFWLLVSCGLMLIQPHLSGTIIIGLIGTMLMFVAGCQGKHIILFLLAAGALAVIAFLLLKAMGYDYFGARWLSFTNPEADILDKTFQTYQSLVTIGSGGFFGLGLGNSRQKYSYLPESQNDFVFSIICEEIGFVGAILVILLFVIFVMRGFYIASRARDKFGMLLCTGITFQIGLQAMMNIAVACNAMPNTGISLPFFSYGGTALMMQLAEVGIVLNISRKAALE